MKKFIYFDESFDSSHTNNYELNIQFGKSGYAYCVNSLLSDKCVAVGADGFGGSLHSNDLAQRLSSFLDSQDFLGKNFSKVNFVYSTEKSTLVPKPFFVLGEANGLFQFNHHLLVDESLEHCELSAMPVVQVFAGLSSLATVMVNRYKQVHFRHQMSSLIPQFTLKTCQKEAQPMVLAHFTDDLLDVVVAQQQKLLLHNTFELGSPTDALYHLSNLLLRLELPAHTALHLAGDVDENSTVYPLLRNHFAGLRFFTDLSKPYVLAAPRHQLANLICM